MKSFRDLTTWQESHKLVILIYKLTSKFPKSEDYCLISQLRRAVISVTSNIAEGFSRFSFKEKYNFYNIALGSLTEIENQIIIARDLNYISTTENDQLIEQIEISRKTLQGLIRITKTRF